jgi:hypothetical protein
MSIAAMVRVTRNMPGKVLGAAIGGAKPATLSKSKSKIQQRQRSKLSKEAVKEAEDAVSAKRLAELEEKVIALLTKPASMPVDKEEILQAAVIRVSALEEELAATKKVSSAPCWKTMFYHTITTYYVISNFNHYFGFVSFCIKNNNLKHYEVYDYSIFLNQLACFKTCFDLSFCRPCRRLLSIKWRSLHTLRRKRRKAR